MISNIFNNFLTNSSFRSILYLNFNKLYIIKSNLRLLSTYNRNIRYKNNYFTNNNIDINNFIPLSNNFKIFFYSTKAVIPESYSDNELETVDSIKMLIEKRIRPVVQQDGGDVSFVSFDPSTGFVYVRLSGACVGCIQSDITLKHMIQGMLCHYIDEITAVYNVDENNNVVTSDSNNDY